MAGLLGDSWDDPRSSAIMALAGGLLRGDVGAGLLGANNAYAQAKEGAFKQKYMQAQMDNLASEVEQRKAAIAKQQQIQAMTQRILQGGGGYAPAQPGQIGSGTGFGVLPAPPQGDMPERRPSGLMGASLEDIAGLHAVGGPDLLNAYKFGKEGIERKPGSFVEDMNGRRQFIPKISENMTYDGTRASLIPGVTDALTQTTLAQEAPKALFGAAGRVNLRDNQDGTKSPVSELTENPTLQNVLNGIFGSRAPGVPATMPPTAIPRTSPRVVAPPAASGGAPAGSPRVTPEAQRGADAESISMIQAELENPKLTPQDRAALQRDLQRLQTAQAQPGFPNPAGVRLGPYGKTTAQETAEAVDKARRTKQAEADVAPTAQRQNGIAQANYLTAVIDQALNHPGRETATGASGTFDPRNYIPGTDATDFKTVLAQIKGSAFLQAFEGLKGGGQITEVEGAKATDAIARMNTAQSDAEFEKALREFRQVVQNGLTRAKANMTASTGATGSFAGDNSEMVKSAPPPQPMKGMTRNGYRFKGGNPASQNSWEKM